MNNLMKNIKAEFRKISWPTKENLIKDTRDALIMGAILTLFIFFFDSGFSYIVNYILTLF